ncbi:MAG: nicotinate-nucleotide--dimethylbenzimidazole phosphoribosyltransferase [Pseudomonadota bacterium]
MTADTSFAVPTLDRTIDRALQHKIDQKTKPQGALGRLEQLALQIGRVQQSLSPKLEQAHLLIFAGDHGAAKSGISAYPQEVTWQMVNNFLSGGAAINIFSRQNGLPLSIVDAGVAHDFKELAHASEKTGEANMPQFIDAKIAFGTRNYLFEPAMSNHQCAMALDKGASIARKLATQGCKVIGFGEMGIGNTASAALLTHVLTGTPLDECIGRGSGLDDDGLTRKRSLLAQAIRRAALPIDPVTLSTTTPLTTLAEFGGFEIAMMTGAMLSAAKHGLLILIDGFIVGAALLLAARLAPEILDYCVFCHRSAEPGHQTQLKYLQVNALLDIDLRLGEGSGVALAWPLVRAAAAFLNEMASFDEAEVSGKSQLA